MAVSEGQRGPKATGHGLLRRREPGDDFGELCESRFQISGDFSGQNGGG